MEKDVSSKFNFGKIGLLIAALVVGKMVLTDMFLKYLEGLQVEEDLEVLRKDIQNDRARFQVAMNDISLN
jgi:hypothetical protein